MSAATVENEPVVPYQTVGHQLSDLADAALTAALAVAIATVCPEGSCPIRLAVIAMGILFLGGLDWRLFLGLALLLPVALGAILIAAPYRLQRLTALGRDEIGDELAKLAAAHELDVPAMERILDESFASLDPSTTSST